MLFLFVVTPSPCSASSLCSLSDKGATFLVGGRKRGARRQEVRGRGRSIGKGVRGCISFGGVGDGGGRDGRGAVGLHCVPLFCCAHMLTLAWSHD